VYHQVRHMQDEELLDAEDFFDFQVSKEGGTVPLLPDGIVSPFSPRVVDTHHLNADPDPAPHQSDGNLRPPVYGPSRSPFWASTDLHDSILAFEASELWRIAGSGSSLFLNSKADSDLHPWFFELLFLIRITPFGYGIPFFISLGALLLKYFVPSLLLLHPDPL
jgi:hypothetical protein